MTFEGIMGRMLGLVPSSLDKREGAVIYDALAPCAVELALMYIELDVILKETFGDTASREYLVRRGAERGLAPLPASYALLRGVFNCEVPIGARFSCGELCYVVTERVLGFEYNLQCESLGVVGNKNFGTLVPIDYIDGLSSAIMTELLVPAEDEEETELFRDRYFESFEAKAYGGNVVDYLAKTNSIAGVGATKVTPVWAGGGTVKLTILDSNFSKESDTLVEMVQMEIDPTLDGYGIGVAPIGHIVTVNTVEDVQINISTSLLFDVGYTYDSIKDDIIDVVEGYFLDICKEWASVQSTTVRVAQIESRIMGVDGVIDIKNTYVNGSVDNFVLNEEQVPVLGGIVID